MFTHALDPVLFSLGPLEIRYYGMAYIIGFLLVWYTLHKHKEHLHLTKDDAGDIAFWLTIGVVVGSRLYSVFVWNPAYYITHPLKIFAVWEGGMAFHGGVIGIIVALFLLCRKYKLRFLYLADILCLPVVFALALGRIANFINGELWGPITNAAWCVQFPAVEGCRHPYQIYAALKRFLMCGVILVLRRKHHKEGFIFWSTLWMFGFGRFFLDFYREDILYAGLSTGQWSAAIVLLVSSYVLMRQYGFGYK